MGPPSIDVNMRKRASLGFIEVQWSLTCLCSTSWIASIGEVLHETRSIRVRRVRIRCAAKWRFDVRVSDTSG